MTPRHADARVARVVAMFESMTPADVALLGDHYTGDARFKDPFNDVQGVPAIQRIFAHMFEALDEPSFVVHDIVADGDHCFLTWDMHFRMKRFSRESQVIRGASHLRFDASGRVMAHRDYWDAAEELYEKLPAIGALMRWLKKRANS